MSDNKLKRVLCLFLAMLFIFFELTSAVLAVSESNIKIDNVENSTNTVEEKIDKGKEGKEDYTDKEEAKSRIESLKKALEDKLKVDRESKEEKVGNILDIDNKLIKDSLQDGNTKSNNDLEKVSLSKTESLDNAKVKDKKDGNESDDHSMSPDDVVPIAVGGADNDPYGYGWEPKDFIFSKTSTGSIDNQNGTFIVGFSSSGLSKVKINGNVNLPTVNYSGMPVDTVGFGAFAVREITNLFIPNNIKRIDGAAFAMCKKLTSVEANGVEEIFFTEGPNFPYTNKNKQEFTIYDTGGSKISKNIGYTFIGCFSLKNFKMDSLKVINASSTFGKNKNGENAIIQTLELPSLEVINGNCNFMGLNNLIDLNTPKLKTINGDANFQGLASLEDVYLPSLADINGDVNFMKSKKLKTVKMPKLDIINGNGNFYLCHAVETVEMPVLRKITKHGNFWECHMLSEINMPLLEFVDGVSNFEEVGNSANKDLVVNLPRLREIRGAKHFFSCKNLKRISFPSLEMMMTSSDPEYSNFKSNLNFAMSGLETADFPKLKTIEGYAMLGGNRKLRYVNTPSLIKLDTYKRENLPGYQESFIFVLYESTDTLKWIINENFDESIESIFDILAEISDKDPGRQVEVYTNTRRNPQKIPVETKRYILNPIRLTFNYINKAKQKLAESDSLIIGGLDSYTPESYPTVDNYIKPSIKSVDLTTVPVKYEIVDLIEDIYYKSQTPDPIKTSIKAKVKYFGVGGTEEKPEASKYKFVLKDNEGNVISESTNDGNGNIVFEELNITDKEIGSRKYTVEQIKGDDPAIEYDTHVEDVTVDVSLSEDNKLSANVVYDSDGPIFINKSKIIFEYPVTGLNHSMYTLTILLTILSIGIYTYKSKSKH